MASLGLVRLESPDECQIGSSQFYWETSKNRCWWGHTFVASFARGPWRTLAVRGNTVEELGSAYKLHTTMSFDEAQTRGTIVDESDSLHMQQLQKAACRRLFKPDSRGDSVGDAAFPLIYLGMGGGDLCLQEVSRVDTDSWLLGDLQIQIDPSTHEMTGSRRASSSSYRHIMLPLTGYLTEVIAEPAVAPLAITSSCTSSCKKASKSKSASSSMTTLRTQQFVMQELNTWPVELQLTLRASLCASLWYRLGKTPGVPSALVEQPTTLIALLQSTLGEVYPLSMLVWNYLAWDWIAQEPVVTTKWAWLWSNLRQAHGYASLRF